MKPAFYTIETTLEHNPDNFGGYDPGTTTALGPFFPSLDALAEHMRKKDHLGFTSYEAQGYFFGTTKPITYAIYSIEARLDDQNGGFFVTLEVPATNEKEARQRAANMAHVYEIIV